MDHRIGRGTTALLSLALLAAACSNGEDAAPETTVAATTTTEAPRLDDGRLRFGLLLPTSDALLGQGLIDAATMAIERINDAGGVLGQPVTFIRADEGSSSATASASIEELLAADVDAIIGPSSSLTALNNLSEILDAGVLSCSPTASSLALDVFPDDDLLFFRTIPSDSLQALAIAGVVEQTGARTAALAFVDDAYGQPYADAVQTALRERGITVVTSVAFRGGEDDLGDAAAALAATEARVAVILASDEDAASLLEALAQADDYRAVEGIVVNDALRSGATAQRIAALPSPLRNRITGVAPQALADDPEYTFGPYAVNAFDCVNLIALAAVQGDSDSPQVIKTQMQSVSSDGRQCRAFEQCVARLEEQLRIDYVGPSGLTELLQRGDPRQARFELFSFDETGRDQLESSIVVSY